jgi:SAM-dependent methyltransferase
LLELGSGTGFQLSLLNKIYKNSTGVEVNSSKKSSSQYPILFDGIIEYDGKILPFEDKSFDVIISSHVMEHIEDITNYDKEVRRVLKNSGMVVHVLPSHVWRIWTSIWHYPLGLLLLFKLLKGYFFKKENKIIISNKMTKRKIIKNLLFSETHGVRGNPLSEIYYFSSWFWKKLFFKNDWDLIKVKKIGFLYWGRDLFRFNIPIKVRKSLSKVLGSSSVMYILKKHPE